MSKKQNDRDKKKRLHNNYISPFVHIFGIHLNEPFAGCQKLDEDKVNITGSWI